MSNEEHGQGQVLRVLGRLEGLLEGLGDKLDSHIRSENPRLEAMESDIKQVRERMAWAAGVAGIVGSLTALVINYVVGKIP